MSFDNLSPRLERLCARRALIRDDEAGLSESVGRARFRIDLKPRVEEVLKALENRAHEKAVGSYEKLLTSLVEDVLEVPGRVRLDLDIKRGQAELDVNWETAGGERENIIDGKGGSFVNIIAAGLRLVALFRTSNRRFLVLDEAECWLAPERVPRFAAVLGQLAAELGIQLLLISHHDPDFFTPVGKVIRMRLADDGQVRTTTLPAVAPVQLSPDSSVPVVSSMVRHIRLVDFMGHADTRIDLAAGVTTLVGENDIGKSAFIRALRAVAYGESADDQIRHGATQCMVEIGLADFSGRAGEATIVQWTRNRKGPRKDRYRLLDGQGRELHVSDDGRRVPDFITGALGIGLVDDFDIQLGHQKSPVFLIDQPPSRQAAILSVGRESGYLRKMADEWQGWQREDRALVKRGEERIARLRELLSTSAFVDDLPGQVARLKELAATCESGAVRLARLGDLLAGLVSTRSIPDLPFEVVAAEIHNPDLPARAVVGLSVLRSMSNAPLAGEPEIISPQPVHEAIDLAFLLENQGRRAVVQIGAELVATWQPQSLDAIERDMAGLARLSVCLEARQTIINEVAPLPSPRDLAAVIAFGRRFAATMRAAACQLAAEPVYPVPREFNLDAIEALAGITASRRALLSELASDDRELAVQVAELDALAGQFGGTCPVCEGPLGKQHDHQPQVE